SKGFVVRVTVLTVDPDPLSPDTVQSSLGGSPMAILAATGGKTIDTDELPNTWCAELIEKVVGLEPVCDPLEEEDADVDPGVFLDELISYARGLFGLKSKAPDPPVFFRDRGRIGHAAYWVFETTGSDGDALYLFLLRKGAVTEI